jgi:hypothetical protein
MASQRPAKHDNEPLVPAGTGQSQGSGFRSFVPEFEGMVSVHEASALLHEATFVTFEASRSTERVLNIGIYYCQYDAANSRGEITASMSGKETSESGNQVTPGLHEALRGHDWISVWKFLTHRWE